MRAESGRLPPDIGRSGPWVPFCLAVQGLGEVERSIYREPGRNLHPRVKGPKLGTSQISFQKTKNRGSGISKKISGDQEMLNCTSKNRIELGGVATLGLGPRAGRKGRVCWSGSEAWYHKPNHRTEPPRKEEKKAEPADLEAGFCQSWGGAYRGGGVWGTSL